MKAVKRNEQYIFRCIILTGFHYCVGSFSPQLNSQHLPIHSGLYIHICTVVAYGNVFSVSFQCSFSYALPAVNEVRKQHCKHRSPFER